MLSEKQMDRLKEGDTLYRWETRGGYLDTPLAVKVHKFRLGRVTAKLVWVSRIEATRYKTVLNKRDLSGHSLTEKGAFRDAVKQARVEIKRYREMVRDRQALILRVAQAIREAK